MAGNFRFGAGIGGGLPVPGASRPTYITWTLLSINVLLWLILEYIMGGSTNPQTLLDFGAMFGPFIANGEYWRLLTAMFLHVGIMHLIFNNIGLLIFGRMVEQIYGHVRFVIIYILAGLTGSVASFWLNNIAIGAGASGAIFGVLGAFAAFLLVRRETLGEMGKQQLITIAIIGAINLAFGFTQAGIDNWAHMGGFVGGFAIGYILSPNYRSQEIVGPFGQVTYRTTDGNSILKSWWIIPVVSVVLIAGVWMRVSTFPDNPVSHLRNAERLVIEEQNYTDALAEIRNATRLDPTYAEAYFLRGKILAEIGENRAAQSNLITAIAMGLGSKNRQDAESLLSSLR